MSLPFRSYDTHCNFTTSNHRRHFPRLKAAVLEAINDLSNEMDNTAAVCQRAKDYVHMDECILTYGYSRIVELFLKAAGAKRRFQVGAIQ